jgi:thiamine kinase-like enzyme/predicted metal-dependent phosphoesterase TrpH
VNKEGAEMLIEMHAHTSRYSPCSHIDAADLVRQAVRKGLQGLIITEHHYLWNAEEIAELRVKAEVESHFALLAAQEVDTDIGHVLVYGADRTIEEKIRLKELRKLYPDAALVWAHPLRDVKSPSVKKLDHPCLDAIEIFSSNHTQLENYRGLSLWHQYKFTAISGSDTHAASTAGILPTQFDHPVSSIEDVVSEIKSGRCRPFYKEIPKAGSNIVVHEITFGTKGEDESRSRIILKAPGRLERWRSIKEASDIMQQVYNRGFSQEAFRVPRTLEVNEKEKLIVEEGQRGRSLFELLIQVSPVTAQKYYTLAAQWLARLHKEKIRFSDIETTAKREKKRFSSYLNAFVSTNNLYVHDAKRLMYAVERYEEALFEKESGSFILVHGDYHPKNVIIGQDRMHDVSTVFISVIDFAGAMLFHRAFDVGYFIAQFHNQFRDYPHVLQNLKDKDFVNKYCNAYSQEQSDEFLHAVNLFRIRANMSIGAYLIKVGKGNSEDMGQIMAQSLNLLDMVLHNAEYRDTGLK